MTDEHPLWKGSPSQWLNLGPFSAALLIIAGLTFGGLFFPLLFIALIFPIGYMIWKYLLVRSQIFELTSERLRITTGILNQKIDEIELYRVKDSQMVRPWWMRLTGLASILLETSDRSMAQLTILPFTVAQWCGKFCASKSNPNATENVSVKWILKNTAAMNLLMMFHKPCVKLVTP
jgi:uncharacterized membrane protein YdbT with pleckstrin-like domain